jgi:hypothetical protein
MKDTKGSSLVVALTISVAGGRIVARSKEIGEPIRGFAKRIKECTRGFATR